MAADLSILVVLVSVSFLSTASCHPLRATRQQSCTGDGVTSPKTCSYGGSTVGPFGVNYAVATKQVLNPVFNVWTASCAECLPGAQDSFCLLCSAGYTPVTTIDCISCFSVMTMNFNSFSLGLQAPLVGFGDPWITINANVTGRAQLNATLSYKGPYSLTKTLQVSLLNGGIAVPDFGYILPSFPGVEMRIGFVVDLVFQWSIAPAMIDGEIQLQGDSTVDWGFTLSFDSREPLLNSMRPTSSSVRNFKVLRQSLSGSLNMTATLLPQLKFSFPTLSVTVPPPPIPGGSVVTASLLDGVAGFGPTLELNVNAAADQFPSTSPLQSWAASQFVLFPETCQVPHHGQFQIFSQETFYGSFQPVNVGATGILGGITDAVMRPVVQLFNGAFTNVIATTINVFRFSLVSGCLFPSAGTGPDMTLVVRAQTLLPVLVAMIRQDLKGLPLLTVNYAAPIVKFGQQTGGETELAFLFNASPLVTVALVNLACNGSTTFFNGTGLAGIKSVASCKFDVIRRPPVNVLSVSVQVVITFGSYVSQPNSLATAVAIWLNVSPASVSVVASTENNTVITLLLTGSANSTGGAWAALIIDALTYNPTLFQTPLVLDARVSELYTVNVAAAVAVPIVLCSVIVGVAFTLFVYYTKRKNMALVAATASDDTVKTPPPLPLRPNAVYGLA
jgi:hypothetical protein